MYPVPTWAGRGQIIIIVEDMDKDKERPALDWFEQMLELVKSNSSIDHKILKDPSGSLKWLEISSTKCHIDPQLGPIRAVRLVVSTTRTYKVDVLYPIPRSVERLKGKINLMTCNKLLDQEAYTAPDMDMETPYFLLRFLS